MIKHLAHFFYKKRGIFSVFFFLLTIDVIVSSHSFFSSLWLFPHWNIEMKIKRLLYIGNYLAQIMIIVLLLTSKNKILNASTNLFLFLTFSIYLTYYFINGYGFTFNEATVAISEFTLMKGAFINFGDSIFWAIGLSVLGLLFIYIFFSRFVYNKVKPVILTIAFVALIIAYMIGGVMTAADRLFFIPYKIAFDFYYAFKAPMYLGVKSKVIRESAHSKIDKIVFVVDESIRGDKLSINGFDKSTTPFLKSIKDSIINYGIACSAANCSGSSNTILRSGLMQNSFPDKEQFSLKNPNIWAYAKKAGYHTVFIDAQNTSDRPKNNMNKYDFTTIDKYIQIGKHGEEFFMRDFEIIKILKTELERYKKVFIYINKFGAHFPYARTYPQSKKIFTPTLDLGEAPSLNKKEELLNTYYNSIRWSVDLWWEKVYFEFKKKDILFIYTSDHGQNIFDNENKLTHCSPNPISTEGNVPLFLIPFGKTKTLINHFKDKNININFNHTSHFNLFPTILFLEGYSLEKNEFSLFDNVSEQNRFFCSGDIWRGGRNFKKNNFEAIPDM